MSAAGADDDHVAGLAGGADEGDRWIAVGRLDRDSDICGHPADCGAEGPAGQDRRRLALLSTGEAQHNMRMREMP